MGERVRGGVTGCIRKVYSKGGRVKYVLRVCTNIVIVDNDCIVFNVLHSEGMLPLRGFIAIEKVCSLPCTRWGQ